jgi:uncharacterized protein YfdQ (DUF2303 family)
MTEEQKPAQEKIAIPGALRPEVKTERLAPQFIVQVDKLDEIVGYLLSMNKKERFNTSLPIEIVPNSLQVLDLEKHMPRPSRIRKNPVFVDVASFTSYFNDFKHGYSPRLFSVKTQTGLTIFSVFDYAVAGTTTGDILADGIVNRSTTDAVPQWGSHTAELKLTYHQDYKELLTNSNNWFEQEDFALFVEENTHLFVKPDGAAMMELAQNLKGVRNATWNFGKRLSNGQISLEHIETIEAKSVKGDIVFPETIELRSPIFEGFPAADFKAALRYKIDDRKLKFSYRLMTKLEERAGQDQVKAQVAADTGTKILNVLSLEGLIKG